MISDCVEDHVMNFSSSVCGSINIQHFGGYGYFAFLEAGMLDELMLK